MADIREPASPPQAPPAMPLRPAPGLRDLVFGGFFALVGVILLSSGFGLVTLRDIERGSDVVMQQSDLAGAAADIERGAFDLRISVGSQSMSRRPDARAEVIGKTAALLDLVEKASHHSSEAGMAELAAMERDLRGYAERFNALLALRGEREAMQTDWIANVDVVVQTLKNLAAQAVAQRDFANAGRLAGAADRLLVSQTRALEILLTNSRDALFDTRSRFAALLREMVDIENALPGGREQLGMQRLISAYADFDSSFGDLIALDDSIQRDIRQLDQLGQRIASAASELRHRSSVIERKLASDLRSDLRASAAQTLVVAVLCLLLGIACALLVTRRTVTPILAITDAMRRLMAGQTDVRLPYQAESNEIGQMARATEVFRNAILEATAARRSAERTLADLRQVQEDLAGKSHVIDTALESIGQGLAIFDPQRRLIVANRRYTQLLDLPAGRPYPGETLNSILRFDAERRFHDPFRVVQFVARGMALLSAGQEHMEEVRRADGVVLRVEIYPQADGGHVSIVTDITAAKRSAQLFEESRRLLQTVLDEVPVTIHVKDRDGRYVLVNRYFCSVVGREAHDLLGHTADEAVGAARPTHIADLDAQVFATGQPTGFVELVFPDASGRSRNWLVNKAPMRNASGEVDQVLTVVFDISEQKRAQRDVEHGRRILQTVLDELPVAVSLKDDDLRFVLVNRLFAHFAGLAPEAMIGKRMEDVTTKLIADRTNTQDRILLANGKPTGFVDVERDWEAGGGKQYLLYNKLPLRNADGEVNQILTVTLDITRQKIAEQEIEQSRRTLQTVLDSLPVVIHLKDADRRYLLVNRYFSENVVGLPPERMLGKMAHEVFGRRRSQFVHDYDDQVLETGRETGFVEVVHPDASGTVRTWLYNKLPIKSIEGRVSDVLTVALDITHLKEVEAELKSARDQAESAARAKAEFLAIMSHEIRTPMNGVMGMARLLLRAPLPTSQREQVETILRSSRALLGILDNILDFSKLEAGQAELEQIDFSLPELIDSAMSMMAPRAAEKPALRMRMEIDPALAPWHRGDPTRLRQVMLNLLGNALKFTEAGEIAVIARVTDDGPERQRIQLDVQDTGIGIAPDQIQRLFAPFTQADSSIARRYGGTGLGLSICKRLVEAMGGGISVRSEVGRGAVFRVDLPLQRGEAPARVADGEVPPLPALHILLAEDNPVNQRVAATLLEEDGHDVVIANDGFEAVALAEQDVFDVILMDMQMPGMDGLEATRRIRGLPGSASAIPIIAMTANAQPEDVEQCLAAGMNEHVGKPFEPARLYRAIERHLGRGGVPAGAPSGADGAGGAIVPPPSDAPVAGDDVDWQRFRHLEGRLGRKDFAEMLEKFIGDFSSRQTELWDGAPDFAAIGRMAHTLKGSAGMVGLVALARAASELDRICRAAAVDPGAARAAAVALDQALQTARGRVDDYFKEQTGF